MSTSRMAKYKGSDGPGGDLGGGAGSPEAAKQLSQDLRRHVRKLAHSEPLSSDWRALVEHASKVASVAYLESRGGKVNVKGDDARGDPCVEDGLIAVGY